MWCMMVLAGSGRWSGMEDGATAERLLAAGFAWHWRTGALASLERWREPKSEGASHARTSQLGPLVETAEQPSGGLTGHHRSVRRRSFDDPPMIGGDPG